MMKSSRFAITILLLLLSTACSRVLVAQKDPARLLPPKTMRLCIQPGCANLVWVGDHYEGRMDGQTALYARYWVRQWTADSVEIYGKTATAMDGVFPAEGTFTGRMSPSGTSVVDGRDDWIIGYRQHGTMPFTATWSKTIPKAESAAAASGGPQVANVAESDDIAFYSPARPSAKHPNIMLPPGASEAFADYPDEVRAVLQPEYGLTAKDSVKPCHDPSVTDANTALEIGRFAYRAGDIARGNCWTFKAQELGSERGKVIYAVGLHMGWYGAKNDVKAFQIYSSLLPTRDPWAVWFLDLCYANGTGTAKDAHQAAILDSWVMTHEEAMNVVRTIGTDDSAQMREKARWETLFDPPTRKETHCTQAYVTAGGIKVPARCDSTSVVDNDALQQKLRNIDNQP